MPEASLEPGMWFLFPCFAVPSAVVTETQRRRAALVMTREWRGILLLSKDALKPQRQKEKKLWQKHQL